MNRLEMRETIEIKIAARKMWLAKQTVYGGRN